MPIILAIVRYLGFAGCCCVLLLFYYEGVPGASRIPFLSNVPILGDIMTGKVHAYAAQQVALATKDMVTKFERDALSAQLSATERLLSDANRTAANARTRADETLRAKEAADARVGQLEEEARGDSKLSYPNDEDKAWISAH
jgi:hypothetical protein